MFCEKCGSEVRETASFCPNCGTSVTLSKGIFSSPQFDLKYEKSSHNPILIALAFFLIVVAVGAGLFLYRQSEAAKEFAIREQEQAQMQREQLQMQREELARQQSEREDKQLKERAQIAFNNLDQEMLQVAQTQARPLHQASNLEGCYSSPSDIETASQTIERTEYVRLFKCRMRGAILAMRRFEVGVKVRGEVVRHGSDFSGKILGSYVDYDTGG